MLVLSRKVGERVVIGDGIILTVLEIKGQNIRVGIEAPREVPVWRAELVEDGACLDRQMVGAAV